ncbi:MAG: hypothetical protein AB1Z66_04450 [Candidatus Limnocylindrales bacterium]
MRLNLFTRNHDQEPEQPASNQPGPAAAQRPTGRTFPADEVVWGIVIRNGFDEMDDPWYHRGTTQHAYLEGNDNVAICGFRPPQSGPRTRRRSRLGLPSAGEHPMCGSCARMVVAPRPRVPVPVQGNRPPVAVPVARPDQQPLPQPMAAPVTQPVVAQGPTAPAPAAPAAQPGTPFVSPWVRNRTSAGEPDGTISIELGSTHDGGLLKRGVHTEVEPD